MLDKKSPYHHSLTRGAAYTLRVASSKSELLHRPEGELHAIRMRAETAKLLAAESSTQKDSLLNHAANIERSAASLDEIIRGIRKAWE